ncbi:MAG TPA: FUSC family protein [Edaphobacter sp.]|nr:FUSC family protein [Edaphobacter sp.]
MSAQGKVLPNTVDQGSKWFWNFLKQELTPYPGRAWVVGRVTISATIVMLLVMTFRIPNGYLGAIFALMLSRENPTATFRAGFRTVLVFLIGTVYTALSVRILVDDPLTHFLWVVGSIFISFYLLRIVDYGTAGPLGFMILGAIPIWDQAILNVNKRMENTLWLAGVVTLGVVVTVAVEYVFRRVHPTTDLTEGIEVRLQTVENVLRSTGEGRPLESEWEKKLSLYSTVGTSRLRRLILRSAYNSHYKTQMGTAIALVGRLVDIAASFQLALSDRTGAIDAIDSQRCLRLADEVTILCKNLVQQQLPAEIKQPLQEVPSQLPFLSTMERTIALIPKAFSGSESVDTLISAPLDEEGPAPIFAADAFSNPAHVQFALRGTLAATVCYVIYTAINWPGLGTSVLTCFITALSTIGSSRQKQVLRLSGAFMGGFIFGMGAQVFVLPYLDSIVGFTLLFATVTAISAWISTASARLSYLGVQLALAFYLINLQEFTIQTSLSIARDRVFGVLLGLVSMGLFFDLLWVRNAVGEMQAVFAHNLEMFAELAEQLLEDDHVKGIRRIRQLRDQINEGFQAVTAQSDAVLLEFGPSRQTKLQIRKEIMRWQPAIRTLLQVQITSVQYLAQNPLTDLAEPLAQAAIGFERDVALVMRAMASEVSEKPVDIVPDIQLSASRVQQEIRKYYYDRGMPIPPQASDIAGLIESIASILSPLYEDIHSTFVIAARTTQASSKFLRKTARP